MSVQYTINDYFQGQEVPPPPPTIPEDERVTVTIEGPKIQVGNNAFPTKTKRFFLNFFCAFQIRQIGETVEFRCNVNQLAAVRRIFFT